MNKGTTMRTNLTIAAAAMLTLATAGCHKTPDAPAKPAAAPETGMPLQTVAGHPDANAEVMRMHRVAGRWQSAPGSIKGGRAQWLTLDISNDKKFSLQVREQGPDGKGDAVDVEMRGDFTWSKDGILEAKGTGAKAPLTAFTSFRGSFPKAGVLKATAPNGESYDLTYRGL